MDLGYLGTGLMPWTTRCVVSAHMIIKLHRPSCTLYLIQELPSLAWPLLRHMSRGSTSGHLSGHTSTLSLTVDHNPSSFASAHHVSSQGFDKHGVHGQLDNFSGSGTPLWPQKYVIPLIWVTVNL